MSTALSTPLVVSSRPAPACSLIVAGEPSGDRIAAGIARTLATWGVGSFGMGGGASEQAGVEIIGDFRGSSAMGLTEVLGGLPAVVGVIRAHHASRPSLSA